MDGRQNFVQAELPLHCQHKLSQQLYSLQQSADELVRQEFERCGNVSETARRLSISRTTVYRHLRVRS